MVSSYYLAEYVYGICTYVGTADTFQKQAGDLRLPVELALGHAQLLLCLRREEAHIVWDTRRGRRRVEQIELCVQINI